MNWKVFELKSVAEVFNGKTPSRSEQRESGHPVLKIRDVDEYGRFRNTFNGFVDTTLRDRNAKKCIQDGDTLILNAAHSATHVASKTFLAGKEVVGALATGEWLMIRPDFKVANPKFVSHWINLPETRLSLREIVNGIHLYPKDVARLSIPLPPLDEQRRIAAVLDQADALRYQCQESLQLIEKLIESVFIDMFGDPVRNSKKLPTNDLSNLAKLERGKFTPRPRNDPSYFGGPYPFIQTGDITRSKGRITGWTQTLNAKGAAVSKEFGAGTVVIAIVGATLGETAIVETPVYCPDSIIGITSFPDKSTPEFIEYLLRLWKPRLKELAPDAARANLNLERLRPLQALAPDIGEQKIFSRVAKDLRSLVLAKNESSQQLNNLFSSLQQRAFRGELDLSKVKLGPEEPKPAEIAAKLVETVDGIFHRPGYFPTPPELEAEMMDLESKLDRGHPDSIPWNENYFKYRILSQVLRAPFTFQEIWEQVEYDIEEPDYDTVKDKVFEYVEQGLLEQRFDEETKRIVFWPPL